MKQLIDLGGVRGSFTAETIRQGRVPLGRKRRKSIPEKATYENRRKHKSKQG